MKLPISQRLLACCSYVNQGDRVADVGCDHGYLSIHLLTQGIARSAIASDVKEQPLLSAVTNGEKYGVQDRMEFYVSDGVQAIPRDFDTLVCAGMGGDTMVAILSAAPWLKDGRYRLVLQCQSKTPLLRRYLSDNGWAIRRETALRDGRFLYTVMEVLWQPASPRLTLGQWYFPPALLADAADDVPAYFRWVLQGLRIATEHKDDPEKRQALAELTALAQQYPRLLGGTEEETL